jgi:CheY-like chemotaxis protein
MAATMTPKNAVLVVDDEPAIRGLLSLLLEDENYHVETASDGQEALRKVEQRSPDVIVLDLMLPRMDGWEVIDAISEGSVTSGIPIIAVSAAERYMEVGDRGVQAFLSKPFDIATLLAVLEEVLQ